jgi:hypothetical protein
VESRYPRSHLAILELHCVAFFCRKQNRCRNFGIPATLLFTTFVIPAHASVYSAKLRPLAHVCKNSSVFGEFVAILILAG